MTESTSKSALSITHPEERKPRRAKNIPKRVGEPRRGGGDAGAAAAEAGARSGRPEYVQVDQKATRVLPGKPEYVQVDQKADGDSNGVSSDRDEGGMRERQRKVGLLQTAS